MRAYARRVSAIRYLVLVPVIVLGLVLGGACAADEPATITLEAGAGADQGLRLADGALVTDGADLTFHHAMVMSLRSPAPASICARGPVASVADIAVDDDCAGEGEGWAQFAYLDACTTHTLEESAARGLGFVVLDRAHEARYRVRVVGDAYGPDDGASVVLEVAPAP